MASSKKRIRKDISRYERLLRKEKRLEYFLTLSRLYEKGEEFVEAEKLLAEAVERFPDLSSVKVALAHVLNKLERPKEARQLLEPILSKDRDNLLAARRLAESYECLGELDKALQTYKSILRFRLVGQEVKGHIERIERQIAAAREKEPKEDSGDFLGIPTLSLARLYMEQGHFREATSILERILEVNPSCEECGWLLSLAKTSLEEQKADRASAAPEETAAIPETLPEEAEAAPAMAKESESVQTEWVPAAPSEEEFRFPEEIRFEEQETTPAEASPVEEAPPIALEEAPAEVAEVAHPAVVQAEEASPTTETQPEEPPAVEAEVAEAEVAETERVEEQIGVPEEEAAEGPQPALAEEPQPEEEHPVRAEEAAEMEDEEPPEEAHSMVLFSRLKTWLDGASAPDVNQ
ncbi:MAG: tetratricopeptide repeat protein [Candidatus Coatesbacteria bacterium]|nr:tetratricopeptide repeat protein [Candidatus Coatesbacteria bacterium]